MQGGDERCCAWHAWLCWQRCFSPAQAGSPPTTACRPTACSCSRSGRCSSGERSALHACARPAVARAAAGCGRCCAAPRFARGMRWLTTPAAPSSCQSLPSRCACCQRPQPQLAAGPACLPAACVLPCSAMYRIGACLSTRVARLPVPSSAAAGVVVRLSRAAAGREEGAAAAATAARAAARAGRVGRAGAACRPRAMPAVPPPPHQPRHGRHLWPRLLLPLHPWGGGGSGAVPRHARPRAPRARAAAVHVGRQLSAAVPPLPAALRSCRILH